MRPLRFFLRNKQGEQYRQFKEDPVGTILSIPLNDTYRKEKAIKEFASKIDAETLQILKREFDNAKIRRSLISKKLKTENLPPEEREKLSELHQKAGQFRSAVVDIFKEILFRAEQQKDDKIANEISSILKRELTNSIPPADKGWSKEDERADTIMSLPSIEIKTKSNSPAEEVRSKIAELNSKYHDTDVLHALVEMGKDKETGTEVKEILLEEYKRAYKIYAWYKPREKELIKKYGPLTEKIPLEASNAIVEAACKHEDEDIRNLGERIKEKKYENSADILLAFDYGENVCYVLKKVFEELRDRALVIRFLRWREEYLEKEYSYKISKNENK